VRGKVAASPRARVPLHKEQHASRGSRPRGRRAREESQVGAIQAGGRAEVALRQLCCSEVEQKGLVIFAFWGAADHFGVHLQPHIRICQRQRLLASLHPVQTAVSSLLLVQELPQLGINSRQSFHLGAHLL